MDFTRKNGARITHIRKTNVQSAGAVLVSNNTEILGLTAASIVYKGRMVSVNDAGEIYHPDSFDAAARVVGCSIEAGEAGDEILNQTLDNTGHIVPFLSFGGAWIVAEDNIGIGKSPYVRFTTGNSGEKLGVVRSDEDVTDGNGTARRIDGFSVRQMSRDGSLALVIPTKMHI
jgi:hypothetical protein